jgi:archaellum component FlaC
MNEMDNLFERVNELEEEVERLTAENEALRKLYAQASEDAYGYSVDPVLEP